MLLLVFSIFSSLALASKIHGPNLISLSWSALFISLGLLLILSRAGIWLGILFFDICSNETKRLLVLTKISEE